MSKSAKQFESKFAKFMAQSAAVKAPVKAKAKRRHVEGYCVSFQPSLGLL
jgi:hypothetical protein